MEFIKWKNILILLAVIAIVWLGLWWFLTPSDSSNDTDDLKEFIQQEKQEIIESNRRTMEFVDSSIQNLERYEKLDYEDSILVHDSNLDTKRRLLREYLSNR